MPRKQTRKQRRNRWCGGGLTMDMERIVDNEDIKIDPRFSYYLKLGKFHYFEEETGDPVFEQNGQMYTIDPRSSIVFKAKM